VVAVRGYVGVTDWDWYEFLRNRAATEVNFWQPSGGGQFGAIPRGAPFLFKSKARAPRPNRIVGGGFLSGWVRLPVRSAWDIFGEGNGCASYAEMSTQIQKYRSKQLDNSNRDIGCIMLRDVLFFEPEQAPAAPPDWSNSIVQGKSYDLASAEGSYVEHVIADLFSLDLATTRGQISMAEVELPGAVPGDVFADPRLSPVRAGQAAFKALVLDAYGRRCAITGDKIVPVLQAAHIRPITDEGQNRIDKGLLLRSDVHTLFDRGYLGVHPNKRTLMVSPRLRTEWGNGEEFYQRAHSAEPISTPDRKADRPNTEFLTWHADTLFLAS
jgi:putative restriction endonuclease